MERKLGVSSGCLAGVPEIEALRYLKDAGFDCFFTGKHTVRDVGALKNEAEKIGIDFEFIHAPWNHRMPNGSRIYMNEFWKPGIEYLPLFEDTITAIDSAADAGVKTICQHVTGGWVAPAATDIGFSRFDALVEYAIKKGVRIAFENLRTIGSFAALMERYERVPEVGFCYDCGHEYCYTETVPFLDLYGKRTFCTHLHDNFGRDKEDPMKDADYHLLPYDGTFDYGEMIRKMDKYGYEGSLMLEVGQYGKYKEMSPEAFAAHLYSLIVRVSKGE